jgi:hypothetical protein
LWWRTAARCPPQASSDHSFTLDALDGFWGAADSSSSPSPPPPRQPEWSAAGRLRRDAADAVVLNVGRGATIDEQALYDALSWGRIGGAIIDTCIATEAGRGGVLPSAPAVPRARQHRDDPTHVGLDDRHDPAPALDMAANVNARMAGTPCVKRRAQRNVIEAWRAMLAHRTRTKIIEERQCCIVS